MEKGNEDDDNSNKDSVHNKIIMAVGAIVYALLKSESINSALVANKARKVTQGQPQSIFQC